MRWPHAIAVIVVGLGSLCPIVAVGDELLGGWRGTAGVRTSVIWSDNLQLESDGGESGSILTLLPYVSTSRNGNRFRASVNYSPGLLFYPDQGDRTRLYHVLSASANAELIERYLFLDVRAQANQALINPRQRVGFDAITNDSAFAQTASISVTPRIVLPIVGGRVARIDVEPGIGAVYTADTAGDDGRTSRPTRDTRLRIRSGSNFVNAPWSLQWRRQLWDADNDEGIGSLSASLSYIFSRRYRVTGIVGYDDGDFVARNGRSRGTRWEVQFLWQPKPTSSLRIGGGQAFFGDFGSLRVSHRHKRWVLDVDYSVSVETATTAIATQQIVALEDPFGNPITDPFSGEVIRASVTTPALIDDSFLRSRLRTSLTYDKGRNYVRGDWLITDRDYSRADLDTRDNQWRVNWRRTLSSRMSGNAQIVFWDHSESGDSSFDYTQQAVSLGLTYQLGARSDVSARLARQERDAQSDGGDFSENRVTLELRFRL